MQRLAAAMRIHEAGRFAEAEALYRGVLAEAARQPHAMHLLGVLLHQQGRHTEAADLITQAIAVESHPIFHSNLAAVYLDLNRLDDTIAHARAALALQPGLANAHHNLGVALMRQGRYDEAIPEFTAAIRQLPMHIEARCNLASTLFRQGRLHDALACLQQAVRVAPQHAQVQNDLGGVLLSLDQHEDAVRHFRTAIQLRPDYPEAHSNLGLALRDLGRFDEAIASFHEALRLNPRYVAAHNNLAYTLEFIGKFDAARAGLETSLALEPNNPRALAGLSGLAAAGYATLSDEQLAVVRQMVTRTDLPPEDSGRLHFALARQLDKQGDYDAAFAHYRQGNEFRKSYVANRGAAFDPAVHRGFIDRAIAAFDAAYFARTRGFGVPSSLPVFIVGMMRSGTTLAEQILASHPQIHGAGELPAIGATSAALPEQLHTREPYPECMTHLDAPTARAFAEQHLQYLQQLDKGALRVVDKMPFNYLHLGLIATLFPNATIIHCRRDAIDTCLSCYFQNFGQPQAFTLDLAHLGFYFREYERLMAHWRTVLPLRVVDLQYEEMIADPEGQSRRLVDFCGVAWDDRCLRFHETERPIRTASMLQVRKPIYRTAVGRWKRYEKHLQPLIDALAGGGD